MGARGSWSQSTEGEGVEMVTAPELAGAKLSSVLGHSCGGQWRKKRVINVLYPPGWGVDLSIIQIRKQTQRASRR